MPEQLNQTLATVDNEVEYAIAQELNRQQSTLEMKPPSA